MLGADQDDDGGVERGAGRARRRRRRCRRCRAACRAAPTSPPGRSRGRLARTWSAKASRSALFMKSTRKFTSCPWPSAHVEAGQVRQALGEGGDVGAVAGGVLGRGRGAGHHRHAHRLVPAAEERRRLGVHEAAAEVDVLVVQRDAVEVADEVGVGEGRRRRARCRGASGRWRSGRPRPRRRTRAGSRRPAALVAGRARRGRRGALDAGLGRRARPGTGRSAQPARSASAAAAPQEGARRGRSSRQGKQRSSSRSLQTLPPMLSPEPVVRALAEASASLSSPSMRTRLCFGGGALGLALVGDAKAVLDRRDQVVVRLLDRLDVEDAALHLGADLGVGGAQVLGVLPAGARWSGRSPP